MIYFGRDFRFSSYDSSTPPPMAFPRALATKIWGAPGDTAR